jgi:CheY-like chemotaxis protein
MTEPRKLRVLVVEDEAIVAMFIEDTLAELGHQAVAIAGRMDKAADLAKTLDIDLAILDVNLNGEHTYPLAEILSGRNIPFVFATGYGRASLSERWTDATMVQKPFQSRELAAAIAQARAAKR